MKKISYILIVFAFLAGLFLFIKNIPDGPVQPVVTDVADVTDGEYCYTRLQEATETAPYRVEEHVVLNISGDRVTGTKRGTQAGPDMTNGYTGDLKGTKTENNLELVYSYTVEGSQNKELELYTVSPEVLTKIRYVLIEKEGMLVPDKNTSAQNITYSKEPCQKKVTIELCFAKYGKANTRGYADAYTLRMLLDNENGKATGELKLLPAEKDSKVGKFEGTVSAVDRTMMARTMDLWWDTSAEGVNTKEELKIIFGEGVASVGFGEMVDRGDGVYVYKNTKDIKYSLELNDVACSDLGQKESVENYLKKNIVSLSPVKAVLGGTWYVVYVDTNLETKTGKVVYEDGHIQEKRNFYYEINSDGNIIKLTIK